MLTADCQSSVTLISNLSLLFHLPQTAPRRAQLECFKTSILKVVIEHSSQRRSHGTELLAYGTGLQLQTISCRVHRKEYSHSEQGSLWWSVTGVCTCIVSSCSSQPALIITKSFITMWYLGNKTNRKNLLETNWRDTGMMAIVLNGIFLLLSWRKVSWKKRILV